MKSSHLELVTRIKQSVNLIDLAGEHILLKREGSTHVGLCPFHSGETLTFHINEDKGLFLCSTCKWVGDPFTFVMEMCGLDFDGALQLLARRVPDDDDNIISVDWEFGSYAKSEH